MISTYKIKRRSHIRDGRKSRYHATEQLIAELHCDNCDTWFSMKITPSFLIKQKHHFCSKECMNLAAKNGGKLFEAKKKTCLEHFGHESQNSVQSVKDKKKKTFVERYGVENPFESSDIKLQIRKNILERYGVEHTSQIPESRRKFRITCLERFGTENPLQNREIYLKVLKSRSKTTSLVHWKTQEELLCTASYEIAFVEWCNKNHIDFDWQISHTMPDGRVYNIDAFIKDGKFRNTWIEIKGWNYEGGKQKWEWFHSIYPECSQMWNESRLKELGILL